MAARKLTLRNSRGNGNSSTNSRSGRRNSVEQSTNGGSRNGRRNSVEQSTNGGSRNGRRNSVEQSTNGDSRNGRRNSVEQSTNMGSHNGMDRLSPENITTMEQVPKRRRGNDAINRVVHAVNNRTETINNEMYISYIYFLKQKIEMYLRRVKYLKIFKSHKCKQCIVCTFSDTEDYSSSKGLTSTKRFYNVRSTKKIECTKCGILPFNGNEMLIGSTIHTERNSGTMDNSFYNRRGSIATTAYAFIMKHILNIEKSQREPLLQDLLVDKCKFLLHSWTKSPIRLDRRERNRSTNTVNGAINGLTNTVNGAINRPTNTVNGAIDRSTNTVNGAINGLTNTVNGAIDRPTNTVNGARDRPRNTVNRAINRPKNTVNRAINRPPNTVNEAINRPPNTVNEAINLLTNTVYEAINLLANTINEVIYRQTNTVNGAINPQVEDIDDKSTIKDENSIAHVSSSESKRNSGSENDTDSDSENDSESERILEDEEKFKNECTTYDDNA
ncbi:hypothetical protein, conserved [Plasmodium ovale]|uniref:Uncharacterized protein n=1 Tax=Plasmodium ovale TaxID=36330 RepID=A0A1C3KI80_PLAOA|nr:hypothetical protein, conserved [Plasmodium ovale]